MADEERRYMRLPMKTDHIYAIYYGQDGFVVGQYLETIDCGEGAMVCLLKLEKGWGSNKKHYINPVYITEIVEFDSFEEYMLHFEEWKEDEKLRKYRGD